MFLFNNATIKVYKLQCCENDFYPATLNATMMITQILKIINSIILSIINTEMKLPVWNLKCDYLERATILA